MATKWQMFKASLPALLAGLIFGAALTDPKKPLKALRRRFK